MQQDGGYVAKMVLDSITEFDDRIATMEVTYPRFIHAEIMTHRDRARNAASSRAIPWKKMLANVTEKPVVPIQWGEEKSGMVTGQPIPDTLAEHAQRLWLQGRDYMSQLADRIHNIGLDYVNTYDLPLVGNEQLKEIKIHKSLPNRLVEPWMWITVIMTATDWKNLFRLRVDPDAEIHFQKIAGMMKKELEESTPRVIPFGGWHLPYVSRLEQEEFVEMTGLPIGDLRKVSTARCARVSYLTHEGTRDVRKDLELFDRLCKGSGFGHWSPHEHVATPATSDVRSGPYRGWIQYRKFFKNECAKEIA